MKQFVLLCDTLGISVRDPPEPVRLQRNPERRILHVHGVEVHPDGQHSLGDFDRGLHVMEPMLYGPGAKTVHLCRALDADSAILVPAQSPVRACRFVEGNSADDVGLSAQKFTRLSCGRAVLASDEFQCLCIGQTNPCIRANSIEYSGEPRKLVGGQAGMQLGPIACQTQRIQPSRSFSHSSSHLIE